MTKQSGAPEVVVVGGGVVGAATTFQLARLGARVTLLERDTLASGASGRSGALVRTHYPDAPEAILARAALDWFANWQDRVGGDCGFVRTGFLQLVTATDHDLLRRNTATLREVGVDTTIVDAHEIRSVQPGIAVADDTIAAYEPNSGYADPVATTESLAAAARRLGADIRLGTAVRQLRRDGDRVVGVETDHECVYADRVVLANGAWSVPLLDDLGVELPIRSIRGQAAIVERPEAFRGRAGHLAIIDRRSGIYLRPEGTDETLVGLSGMSEAEALATPDEVTPSTELGERAVERITQALPAFADSKLLRVQAGPLDITPDHCALLGAAPGVDGVVLAVGMSGSGFKKAPAVGACIAELIVSGASATAPIAAFDPARFERADRIERNDYLVGGSVGGSRQAVIH